MINLGGNRVFKGTKEVAQGVNCDSKPEIRKRNNNCLTPTVRNLLHFWIKVPENCGNKDS